MAEGNPLKVVFTVSENGTVVGKTKEQIEPFYQVKVCAVLNGYADGSVKRDNPGKDGRKIEPGDALEIEGELAKVLQLIQDATR